MTGDPDQFHQIFNNLITNAIEAIGDSHGKITINIYPDENKNTHIEIIDEGVGIDKNDLGKIFKSFYTKKIGGMGIGLTVVRKIVSNYKGHLHIESAAGKGTKIGIIIPES